MRQSILAFILIIMITATIFVWYAYIRKPGDQSPGATAPASAIEDQRLAQYRQIEALKPDTSILSDPLFQSLSRYVSPNPAPAATPGRINPFLPF